MKLIAIDQASINSGWAVFEDGKYIDSGVITKSNKIPIVDRVPQMATSICAKIKESDADVVYIEGIQTQSNQKTVIDLARLQGGIMMWCSIKKIPLHIISPNEWRKILGYQLGPKVKREQLKEQSMNYVKEHFGLENISEDRAEAMCIGAAACTLV